MALDGVMVRLRSVPPFARFVIAAGLGAGLFVALRGHGVPPVDFNAEVRPILNGKCISCHGGVKRSGGFGVLFREDALAAGESGRPGIVPGNAGASELIRRVTHADPAERMPHEGDPLTPAEIRTLKRWIDQGAAWGDHWAYALPEAAAGTIDGFIRARLAREGLQPSPPAPCHVQVRRVSLDLTGMPPTPETVDAFCADPGDSAYAALVDTLLASPRFGEHWAAMWMDLARYADTKGYEKDQHRDIWPYRDWVIRAFNADMPFDAFTVAQLAGDLLPDASDDDLLATAFHRNTMTNDEDGTDDEEFRVAAVIDRVNTTMEVWQGTTIGCVQCHSHPYDPIRHEEYYGLFAIFNNTLDGDRKDDGPRMPLYDEEGRRRVTEILSRLDSAGGGPVASRVERVVHPMGWMPAADFAESHGVMATGDYVAPLDSVAWVRYSRVPMSGVGAIGLGLSGREGEIELRLASPDGELIGSAILGPRAPMRRPRGGLAVEPTLMVPIAERTGTHDLVLVMRASRAGAFRVTSVSRYPLPAGGAIQGSQPRRAAAGGGADPLVDALLAVRPEIEVPILRERPAERRRVTQLFEGGNWMVRTDTILPGVPDALGDAAPADRLAFARWLVSEENPLTARVVVNRLWARLFGSGIVATLTDFGTQGDPPSHPELLDYLALRFQRDHAWSVKAMLREIVLSETYRQSSKVNPVLLEADPANRLLARAPRVRLSAEQVRDQALRVAGLLSEKMYGPGVMPPQPPGVWSSPYNDRSWETSPGEDRYRRAVYTYWKRTSPYPSMIAFDAPSREFCVSLRLQTNTPLQALVTLNDTVYVEAAGALARRAMDGGGAVEEQIRRAHRLALLTEPDSATLATLVDLHRSVADANGADVALATVATVLMNLDAFLTRE